MSPPRLLPIVAVAIGGVLAAKALSGAAALPDLMGSARAEAEALPHGGARHASAPPMPTSSAGPQTAAAAAPPARASLPCIQSPTELAREAGMSPGELQVLQNLGARRSQLDDRERALDTQLQLLAAAEAKVDAKLKAVTAVKAQIQGLLGQAGDQQQADIDRLTLVYQKMKPRDAAAVMATLDENVRLQVAAKMKNAALAAILGQMPTVEAKKLTESLARRGDSARQALAAAEKPPAPAVDPAAQSSDPLTQTVKTPPARPRRTRPRPRVAALRPATPSAAAAVALAPAPKTIPVTPPLATASMKPSAAASGLAKAPAPAVTPPFPPAKG